MLFAIFKDQFTWNITLLFIIIFMIMIYLIISRNLARKRYDHKFQPILFIGSLFILYFIKGTPLSVISHFSFSTHMLQMSLFYFLIPPLFLLSIPHSFFQLIHLDKRKNSDQQFIHPIHIFSLFLFGIGLFIYHLPKTGILIMENPIWQEVYLWILFLLAIIMWFPLTILNPPFEKGCFNTKYKYTRLKTFVITPACVMLMLLPFVPGINPLIFHMATLCIPQEYIDHLLPFPFNTKYDQQFGGLLMFLMHKLSISMTMRMGKVIRRDQLTAGI